MASLFAVCIFPYSQSVQLFLYICLREIKYSVLSLIFKWLRPLFSDQIKSLSSLCLLSSDHLNSTLFHMTVFLISDQLKILCLTPVPSVKLLYVAICMNICIMCFMGKRGTQTHTDTHVQSSTLLTARCIYLC